MKDAKTIKARMYDAKNEAEELEQKLYGNFIFIPATEAYNLQCQIETLYEELMRLQDELKGFFQNESITEKTNS